ncbi:UPF0187-domain-containing protein [Clavulina sp. PMI_390]|nr:UPF0187-domain-containing protein [Clavulina sp. PMI_390]
MTQTILRGRWNYHRLTATVINDIAVEIGFFTLWAVAIVLISEHRKNLGISSQMLTVLGTVLGLVISFRTTSAYDRYWEGRKLWASVTVASRNLANIIWIQVPTDRKNAEGKDAHLRATIEKKTMVNLVQAFSVAMKHYLRGESGIFYEDLYPLVSVLPQHGPTHAEMGEDFKSKDDMLPLWSSTPDLLSAYPPPATTRSESPGDMEKTVADSSSGPKLPPGHKLSPARNPPKKSIYDWIPLLLPIKPFVSMIMHFVAPNRKRSNRDWMGRKIKREINIESNVPLEITLFLSSYLSHITKLGLVGPPILSAYWASLASFQDSAVALERIRSNPIPYAYQMHLRMSTWLYLLFLPFQIYSVLKWVTVPATAFAAFLFLGFLEIGAEIEDPFDYDENDLDVDRFCEAIGKELAEITAHPVALDPAHYIFGEWNQPFAPGDMRSADTIIANEEHDYHHPHNGSASLRRTLLRSWRDTNQRRLTHTHF